MCLQSRKVEPEVDTSGGGASLKDDCSCSSCVHHVQQSSDENATSCNRRRVASDGDIVTIDLTLTPEDGLVPEPLFDKDGKITFVLGWGNYLPGLHELVKGKGKGDRVENVSIDAGWGERNPELIMELPKSKLKRFEKKDGSLPPVGTLLNLQGGIQLSIVQVKDDEGTVVVDANPPLAGASYACSFEILNIEDMPADAALSSGSCNPAEFEAAPSRYEVSTWALGCFWGGELAFLRTKGVVGTRVGYSQGIVSNPSYEAVCTGKTRHREAIMVIYDPDIVSYRDLMKVALDRLAATKVPISNTPSALYLDMFSEEDLDEKNNTQYRHGFYFHSEKQREIAERELEASNPYDIELKKAAAFYDAEEYHQQYLFKGGQSARKGAKEPIRCYG